MRTKSLVLIIIALGCGLVASIGISEVLKQQPSEGGVETEPILVAAMDIDINAKLDAQNVKIEQWPKGKIPEGVLHALEEVQDQYTRARMYSGEPILGAKLMASKDEPAPIPEGYRAIPVKVDLDTVVGLIQPGDLVDVMVFLRPGPDVPRAGAYTILRMARVYAVNSQTDRETDSKGNEAAAKTVSLLVKPKQAERLTLATEMGKIRLALRRPSDDPEKDEELERDLPAIFRDGDMLAVEKAQSVQPVVPAVVPTVVTPVEVAAIAVAKVHSMQILSPGGVQQYDWTNEKDLPQESTVSGTAPAPKTPAEPSAPQADDETLPEESD
jgi:pilus assembly protein CpaB